MSDVERTNSLILFLASITRLPKESDRMNKVTYFKADEQIDLYNAIKRLLRTKNKVTLISISFITEMPLEYLYNGLDDIIIILDRVSEELSVR
jgi:hypothetical protein